MLDTTSLIHIKIIPVHLRLRTGRECHQCLVQTRPLGPPQECALGAAVARPAREEAPQLAVASRLPHLSLHGDQSRHSLQLAQTRSCLCLRTTARYVYSTTENNLSHARMVNDSWWKKRKQHKNKYSWHQTFVPEKFLGLGFGCGYNNFWVLGIIPNPIPKTQFFLGKNVWLTCSIWQVFFY